MLDLEHTEKGEWLTPGWNIDGDHYPVCRSNSPSIVDTDTSSDGNNNYPATPGIVNGTGNIIPIDITLTNSQIVKNIIVLKK